MRSKAIAVTCLVAVLVFLAAVSAQAETVLMKNEQGEVKKIEMAPVLTPLTTEEQEAYANPGKEITLASRITEWKRVDFLHVAPIRHSTVVVFSDGRLQTMDRIAEDGSDEYFSHAVFCLIALGCMIVSNLLVIVLPRVKSVAAAAAVAVTATNEWKVYITCFAFFYIFLVLALFL